MPSQKLYFAGTSPVAQWIKILTVNAWDVGSIPGRGRPNMPRSKEACTPQLWSLRSRAHVP